MTWTLKTTMQIDSQMNGKLTETETKKWVTVFHKLKEIEMKPMDGTTRPTKDVMDAARKLAISLILGRNAAPEIIIVSKVGGIVFYQEMVDGLHSYRVKVDGSIKRLRFEGSQLMEYKDYVQNA